MKKVLIIANQYPPMGGSGVQRSAKFVKYLGRFGYEPIVLTREMHNGLLDNSLFDDLPDHRIYRTKAKDLTLLPGPFSLLGKVITRKIMIPDGDYFWSLFSYEKAVEIIEKNHIDVIYTTSFPYSSHLLGVRLKERFPHLPWIVDFRDEWTKNPYILDMNYPKYRLNKEKKMEAKVIRKCDRFITNTKYMLDNFLEDYKELKEKSYVIPNGYDDSDFSDVDKAYTYGETFTLTYTGAMYGRRKPDKVFAAIRNLLDKGTLTEDNFKLQLIGAMDEAKINGFIQQFHLESMVSLHSYMPHKNAIQALVESDALLLIIGDGKGAKNFASGKIFEYINCERPILAVVPKEGAAADIIRETAAGVICETSSIESIEQGIDYFFNEWKAKDLIKEPNWEAIKQYHRQELTRRLAEVFDGAIADK